MRILSWNVAGLRACIRKGFHDVIRALEPDVICLQEVKATPSQVDLELPGYQAIWNPADKAGYSGTMILHRIPIMGSLTNFRCPAHATEGRTITIATPYLYIVTAYVPNSKPGLSRLEYRLEWERDFQDFVCQLNTERPVVLCGDLNVAHEEIDIARPDANHESPGFSDEERAAFSQFLSKGFVDSYRHLHPNQTDAYTYWSYLGNARERNVGWRLDYFVVSHDLMPFVVRSEILSDVFGSDHCPILLDLND